MNYGFDGQVALITGAGAGIGQASALEFARHGARVVVSDIDEESGTSTTSMIRDRGGDAVFVPADISRESDVAELVRAGVERWGRLDFAHNNAGVATGVFSALHETSVEEFDRIIDVNYRGVFLCMKYQIPHLLEQERSAIVVTASRASFSGGPGSSPYTSSKHAVDGLVKSAALEYASRGLRVNAICPSYTETAMTLRHPKRLRDFVIESAPMQRGAAPEEMASVVAWLCSDGASYVNGVALPVDGGSSILPATQVPLMKKIAGSN